MEWLESLSPVLQALLAGSLTWLLTALGAALVFLTRGMPQALFDSMLGFAAGVMISASFWSLLVPAVAMARLGDTPVWLPAAAGFLGGGAFLRVADHLLPHLHFGVPREEAEGPETAWRRSTLLVLAITLHNIPEGLAVGVAFAAASTGLQVGTGATLGAAVALSIGIAIQNIPEGIAVAMPLRREGVSAPRSFWYGQLSAVVEPLAAVVGAAAVLSIKGILPYALAFAAGAMIYVVVEELIPESQQRGRTDLATASTLVGLTVMMVLDLALA